MGNNPATIIKEVTPQPRHARTGKTTHYCDGEPTPTPARLIIVGLSHGYNLIHVDESNQELTDTFHDTVEDAMAQAAFEFSVVPQDWTDVRKVF